MAEEQPTAGFTLRDLVRIIFRYRYTIAGCFVIVTATVVAGLVYLPLTYTAEGKVLVKTEQQARPTLYSGVAAFSERNDSDSPDRRMETEMGILTSTVVAEEVVRRGDLTYEQVYHSPLTHLTQPLIDAGEWTLARTIGYQIDPDKRGFDDTVRELQKSITAGVLRSRTGESTASVIEVKLPAPRADVAQRALALLLEVYLDFERRLNAEAGRRALSIVEADAQRAYADTIDKQEVLRKFLSDHAGVPVGPRLSSQAGAPVIADLADAAPPRRQGSTPEGARLGAEPIVTSPRDEQTIGLLKSHLVQMEIELVELRKIFREDSERIRDHKRNMARLRQRIDEEIAGDASNYTRYGEISRELRVAEGRYIDLQRKLDEISLFLKINSEATGQRVVILAPKKPRSSDLKKKLAIGLGGSIVGLLLGLALAGAREYVEDRVRTTDDLRRLFGVDVLAVVPRPAPGSTARESDAAQASVIRRLCALLDGGAAGLANVPPDRGRTVLVTSPNTRDSKTFIATAMAREMRQVNTGKVLLVGIGHRSSPAVLGLGLNGSNGFGKHIEDDEQRPPANSDLAVLAARDDGSSFSRERMMKFCSEAARRFAWTIFDGAALDDTSIQGLVPAVDLVIVVVDAQDARREVVRRSVTSLQQRRSGATAFVLNNRTYEIPEFIYERL
jgi:uncharacterized protein involved in exopolysaccharide biosynthesis/Mrp family chromosome partitioning ATPase